ncbi:hypothetical protein OPQ81_002621 [Rhizoctonia solani]|nr:hypothetical protein OPQ81_002621 [Rhizoctonia solani]
MSLLGLRDKGKDLAALQHALVHKYRKKKHHTEWICQTWDNNDPFANLDHIEQSTDDQDSSADEQIANYGTNYDPTVDLEPPSKDAWEQMRSKPSGDNEAMLEELAHYQAMIQCHKQLNTQATPSSSGLGSGSHSHHHAPNTAMYATPVAHGPPAFNDWPPRLPPPVQPLPCPPAPLPKQESLHHHLIPIPELKASISVETILQDISVSSMRWCKINNIIRDLMVQVGMDYGNSWTCQNKQQMGILYAWILKEVPELAIFQNGWASEWIVQCKFNNHLYNIQRSKKQQKAAINVYQGSLMSSTTPLLDLLCPSGGEFTTPALLVIHMFMSTPNPSPKLFLWSATFTQTSTPIAIASTFWYYCSRLGSTTVTATPSDQRLPSPPPEPTPPRPSPPPSLLPLTWNPGPAPSSNPPSRPHRGHAPQPPPFNNCRNSLRSSWNNADGADMSANTNAQAIATPARGNNKRRGNMQASREDTDDGVQPTTNEES